MDTDLVHDGHGILSQIQFFAVLYERRAVKPLTPGIGGNEVYLYGWLAVSREKRSRY
jgi:hypothetical protein